MCKNVTISLSLDTQTNEIFAKIAKHTRRTKSAMFQEFMYFWIAGQNPSDPFIAQILSQQKQKMEAQNNQTNQSNQDAKSDAPYNYNNNTINSSSHKTTTTIYSDKPNKTQRQKSTLEDSKESIYQKASVKLGIPLEKILAFESEIDDDSGLVRSLKTALTERGTTYLVGKKIKTKQSIATILFNIIRAKGEFLPASKFKKLNPPLSPPPASEPKPSTSKNPAESTTIKLEHTEPRSFGSLLPAGLTPSPAPTPETPDTVALTPIAELPQLAEALEEVATLIADAVAEEQIAGQKEYLRFCENEELKSNLLATIESLRCEFERNRTEQIQLIKSRLDWRGFQGKVLYCYEKSQRNKLIPRHKALVLDSAYLIKRKNQTKPPVSLFLENTPNNELNDGLLKTKTPQNLANVNGAYSACFL